MSSTHFGFKTVDETEKAKHVRGVFNSVASKYDVMNDLMSMGLHRVWKAYAVQVANLRQGDQVLDIAGGTGDFHEPVVVKCCVVGGEADVDVHYDAENIKVLEKVKPRLQFEETEQCLGE